jgi:hypothetical protein
VPGSIVIHSRSSEPSLPRAKLSHASIRLASRVSSKRRSRQGTGAVRPSAESQPLFVNTAALRPPEAVGFADRYLLREAGDHVELSFFELRPGARLIPVFRTYVPIDDLALTIWPTMTKFLADLTAYFAADSADSWGSFRVAAGTATTVDVLATGSNIINMARSGLDGQIDFHYLTPRSAHLARTDKKKLRVLPVASLIVPARLLVSLLRVFDDLIPGLTDRVQPSSKRIVMEPNA